MIKQCGTQKAIGGMRRGCLSRKDQIDNFLVFEVLVAEHAEALRKYALRMINDRKLADRICRAAFVRAYYRLPHLHRKSDFGQWLREIVSRLAFDLLRRNASWKSRRSKPYQGIFENAAASACS